MTNTPDRREVWQERWAHREAGEFGFHVEDPPPQLVQVLRRGGFRQGAALDIACGAGVATRYLTSWFSPSIGFDIAHGAAAQARATTDPSEHGAFFLVADATAPWPFRDEAFVFAFDRGGLANLPAETWTRYFQEAGRVIAKGGVLQVLASRGVKGAAPTLRGRVVQKLRSIAGSMHVAPEASFEARLRSVAGPAFEMETVERFSSVTRRGNPRQFTQVILRRH